MATKEESFFLDELFGLDDKSVFYHACFVYIGHCRFTQKNGGNRTTT